MCPVFRQGMSGESKQNVWGATGYQLQEETRFCFP